MQTLKPAAEHLPGQQAYSENIRRAAPPDCAPQTDLRIYKLYQRLPRPILALHFAKTACGAFKFERALTLKIQHLRSVRS